MSLEDEGVPGSEIPWLKPAPDLLSPAQVPTGTVAEAIRHPTAPWVIEDLATENLWLRQSLTTALDQIRVLREMLSANQQLLHEAITRPTASRHDFPLQRVRP